MHSRMWLLGLGLLGAALPGGAVAQDSSDGLTISPLPVMPGTGPSGVFMYYPQPRDPDGDGLTIPPLPVAPNPSDAAVGSRPAPRINMKITGAGPETQSPPRRADCGVETYTFGQESVRVRRC